MYRLGMEHQLNLQIDRISEIIKHTTSTSFNLPLPNPTSTRPIYIIVMFDANAINNQPIMSGISIIIRVFFLPNWSITYPLTRHPIGVPADERDAAREKD